MRSEKISVCMATYNGEKYVNEQITSILKQLTSLDELIVVDDFSKDSTIKILKGFKDPRVKIFKNCSNIGVNKSFEKAILLSKNDYIFMADQDDIWYENRVEKMLDALKNKSVNLVSGNSKFIDVNGNEVDYLAMPLKRDDSKKMFKNILKIFAGTGSYFGCAMAFKRELIGVILPFPNYLESHDLWIAIASILRGKSFHLEDIVLFRRVHGSNASIIQRSIYKKIKSRFIFIISIINLLFRYILNKLFYKE